MKVHSILRVNESQFNRYLYYCGLSHFALAFLILLIMPFEHRQIMGINLWIKPLKFAVSIGIYAISWSAILSYFPQQSIIRRFARFTVFALCFEMLAISSQAARGELSHFNQSGIYNSTVYSLMGTIITAQTVFSIIVSIPMFQSMPQKIGYAMAWALRFGIATSILFALQGGYIGYHMSHTIGGTDGSKGILILNWNRQYGDLRIAHFFGIHALQIIPLSIWLCRIKKILLIILIGSCYFLLVSFVFYHALLGRGF
ncbi:hypothetical protein QWY86_04915 [Pedobacter aquatilis]|uniref:hypothetical protein n=1 Tax=Pedobacter aquatilis TaxID=351343 RepID=UPI0025B3A49D|nr:hypothetical protein [Pedobacter aquatilis]MDN3585996.1 hypothetical protein [Pedobacter aquatilis]